MSSMVEQKYISFVASSLDRFKWIVQGRVANFRCPMCDDSQKNKFKARGYFYLIQKSDMYAFRCHNCGASMAFGKLLKIKFPHYYQEFKLENYVQSSNGSRIPSTLSNSKPIVATVPRVINSIDEPDELLTAVSELPEDHVAKVYCRSRLIPDSKLSDLFYTENYANWIEYNNGPSEKKYPKDRRLVMLMKDESGNIFGAQGRALDKSDIRYSTVKFDEERQKIYGIEKLNKELPIFVFEGIIDSLFFPNSIAICGGDIGTSLNQLNVSMDKFIAVLDNECRSKDTIKRMEKAIELGCRICIWPVTSELKDVNEMIKSGMSIKEVRKIVTSNIFSGAKALLKLKQWKKT